MTDESPSIDQLLKNLDQAMIGDRHRLRRQLHELRKKPDEAKLAQWVARVQASCAQVTSRRESVPTVRYDDNLPIAAKRDEIKDALLKHQVLIIAGETGSGKTTQLPKICLEIGRGQHGLIGHTQPRRIAARSVASRVADELATPLGALVGYQVRFEDQSDSNTLIKLMTDGILLAETQHDRFLERYDTIIVDEAHERSLNIDFLLGYLKTLLPRRPDLKVIITSATIDLQRFSEHFNDAPIIEVSGRTFPVDTWYRPLTSEQDEEGNSVEDDLTVDQAILATLEELADFERSERKSPGDVLVFLPGEREIRDAAEMLRKAQLRHTEILPLYARLSPAEQQRIFQSHSGRRVVLATNVAETSLTVPGIRYVIDTGTARISRYSYRAKVQRLPIEAVSQASANQRKGRCGRVEPGLCVRLYSEEDFNARPEFTDPEILRTNLAAVILQMLHLRLGEITDFPFIEPPDGKAISDGFNLLQELSAVNRENQLTPLGRQLARLPVDPRMGRMLLEAAKQGSLQEVLIVASAMSVQDVRERPPERQQAADQAHAQWKDADSDFAGLVNLWRGFEEQRQALTASPLRNWCRRNFLNYLRLREWRDSHRQLSLICRDLQLTVNKEPADYPKFHKAILSGLLSQIGQKADEGDYLGARQRRFWIHPSSGLGKKRPQWLMTAELVETTKLYARMVAKIDADWIEPLAGHLIKKNHFEPHWEKKRGQVVAFEQITLFGLIVVGRRPVHFGPVDPVVSRELFIREGLVRGDIQSRAKCLSANTRLLEQLDELEAKARRRDILADEDTLYAFYEARIPADIHQTATFDSWYKTESQKNPQLLIMREEDVLAREASEVTAAQYPDTLRLGELSLSLTYHFEPNHPRDGVTLRVPAPLLLSLPAGRLEWLVPGLLETKCIALVRSLPKAVRKNFVPVPDFIKAALQRITFGEGSLTEALGRELLRMTGARVTDEAWAEATQQLESHLKMNLEIVDGDGKFLGEGRDLDALTARFAEASQAALAVPQTAKSQQPVEAKVFAPVAQKTQQNIAGLSMTVYPALVEEGGTVKEGRFSTQAEAEYQHRRALQRLLLQQLAEPAKFLRSKLPGQTELALLYRELGRIDALIEDILLASLDSCVLDGEAELPRDGAGLLSLAERKRADWTEHAERLAKLTLEILKLWHGLQKRFKGKIDLAQAVALNDIKAQLGKLVYPGFVRETPAQWLKEMPRYLKAIEMRLEKLPGQVQKDRVWSIELAGLWAQYQARADKHRQEGKRDPELAVYRWWMEEYRVSLFAQQLGTKMPVSDKRLSKQWAMVEG
ncbi:ATP-dependent RNA helicase HrpA [Pseudomonas viridiflava]|uniref:ATP-dependent RNA helicase HrpA n=1 Tax=Pseudomonas viridiflava TaxID=33069 RepID=UPI000F033319|nr:ATP-dependent RNA helicase HrpA [Pseudomonas viridiflava]MEE3913455.1 ATP-dependent RNA helicase HrpA [Pseudomonas viridiflava]MEE3972101.1 ATP-dependent RNA helicase HrpA [Pseudomonas viridiflava]MEE4017147.1 ATP-dependent RNA helicase HrpA [Pseudomonas viridiflava]MEE4045412.1 ATP-dependent RNA helicase HrpA [Pseudomonas viridiflava]MEE4103885.1 ATP-dependent RNA helicase HrpA [Pseudomonas viridiflava]